MAITELQNLQKYLGTELAVGTETGKLLEMADSSLNELNAIVANPNRTYSGLGSKISRQLQVWKVIGSVFCIYRNCIDSTSTRQ